MDEFLVHRRTVDLEVFEDGDHFNVRARLRDDRPWAEGTDDVHHVHDMGLDVRIRRADLTIVEATAKMHQFPHRECTGIESAFAGLVGLSIAGGYSRAVQERFGRVRGCSHLEFLARAIGPAVIQAIPSSAMRPGAGRQAESALAAAGNTWLEGTCHVWASGGPGVQKVELGWRPGQGGYPAPSVAELRGSAGPDPA